MGQDLVKRTRFLGSEEVSNGTNQSGRQGTAIGHEMKISTGVTVAVACQGIGIGVAANSHIADGDPGTLASRDKG